MNDYSKLVKYMTKELGGDFQKLWRRALDNKERISNDTFRIAFMASLEDAMQVKWRRSECYCKELQVSHAANCLGKEQFSIEAALELAKEQQAVHCEFCFEKLAPEYDPDFMQKVIDDIPSRLK